MFAKIKKAFARMIKWFRDYWYYYAFPMRIGAIVFVIIIILVIDVLTTPKPDFDLVIAAIKYTPTDQQQQVLLVQAENIVGDVNGDKKVIIQPDIYNVQQYEGDNGQSLLNVYEQERFLTVFQDDSKGLIIIDEAMKDYFKEQGTQFGKLSDHGFVSDNEYYLDLTNSKLLKAAGFSGESFYAVFKPSDALKKESKRLEASFRVGEKFLKALIAE